MPLHPISSTSREAPPSEPPKHPKLTAFDLHLLKLFKSCWNSPKFQPRPNILLHPISSTSKEATPHIYDPVRASKWPKSTSKRRLFPGPSLKVVKIVLRQPWIPALAKSTASSHLTHIKGDHNAHPWPHQSHGTNKIHEPIQYGWIFNMIFRQKWHCDVDINWIDFPDIF